LSIFLGVFLPYRSVCISDPPCPPLEGILPLEFLLGYAPHPHAGKDKKYGGV
jgi:hypothetical protein